MRKLKVWVSVIAMSFVMVGCGSSGGGSSDTSTPPFSNAEVATGSNAFGYYGENVLFGDIPISGGWDYTIGDSEPVTYYYGDDGVAFVLTEWHVQEELYGVSDDAQDLSFPFRRIVGKSSDNCYIVAHPVITGDEGEFCKVQYPRDTSEP